MKAVKRLFTPSPSTALGRLGLAATAGLTLLGLAQPAAHAEKVLLLTADSRLVTVDSATPGTILTSVPLTGLPTGETLLGIDVRPRDNTLVAVSSASRLYNVNPITGVATAIGTAPFTPAIAGTVVGFDFNPTVDRIRFTTDARQDLRLNPDSGGTAAVDGTETYAATDVNAGRTPQVTGAAYTGSGANATATQLYVIDAAAGVLALQNPPNNGTLTTVGSLGFVPGSNVSGFDISNLTERGYATLTANNSTSLYSISLTTGAATALGGLPANLQVVDVTVPFQNSLRRARATGYVARRRPAFVEFEVGNGRQTGAPVRVLIRGLGPSIGSTLDPQLRVFSANGTFLAGSKNYASESQVADITASGFAPGDANEPAVILILQPGSYYARLNATKPMMTAGNGRIEIFELE